MVFTVNDEIMALRLGGDGRMDGLNHRVIAGAGPQHRPQINGVILAQAHIERAGTGQTHPITAFAEVMGQRGDKANSAACFRRLHITRRAAGIERDIAQGVSRRQVAAHL